MTKTQTQDRIERQIDIDAPAERVWALISRPGWWINDGAVNDREPERDGDIALVRQEEHGDFPIRTERLDPPRHAAFRWSPYPEVDPTQSTLTEFWIEDRDGGVVLKVCESGFDSLDVTAEKRRSWLEGNTEGWVHELAAARTHLEAS